MRNECADLAARLSRMALDLVAELLPAGRREGGEWKAGGIDGAPGRSLSVCLRGAKVGVWRDFATDEGGDLLDLVAAVRCGGDLRAAIAWARRYLGLPASGVAPPATEPAARPAPSGRALDDEDADRRRRAALTIWSNARPQLADTPVEYYLKARGIDLRALGRHPGTLRFHPTVWNAETKRQLPAMVALISGPDGAGRGVHRTWLAQDEGGVWRKAPLAVPKATLGPIRGGLIPLWRGRTGLALRTAAPDEELLLAEGIETALSAVTVDPSRRVAASVSLGNIGVVELPPTISRVIVLADRDDNPKARRALRLGLQSLAARGLDVRVAWPPGDAGDFNDALREARQVSA